MFLECSKKNHFRWTNVARFHDITQTYSIIRVQYFQTCMDIIRSRGIAFYFSQIGARRVFNISRAVSWIDAIQCLIAWCQNDSGNCFVSDVVQVHKVTHSTSMVINLHFMHGGNFTIVSRSPWCPRISSTSQFTQILESESKATFQKMRFEQNSFFSFCVLDIAFTMGSSMSKFVNARRV